MGIKKEPDPDFGICGKGNMIESYTGSVIYVCHTSFRGLCGGYMAFVIVALCKSKMFCKKKNMKVITLIKIKTVFKYIT